MALDGEPVLLGARHAVFRGDMLRRLAHVPVFAGAPKAVVNHGIDGFLVAVFPTAADAEKQIRGPAHTLHAAGDE